MVKKTYSDDDFSDIDALIQGNIVNMPHLLLNEIRDIDVSVGTPLYDHRVKTLLRTIKSHPRIKEDETFMKRLNDAVKLVDDEETVIFNMREPNFRKKPVEKIEEVDYEEIDQICRDISAEYSLTFRKETYDKI